MQIRITCDCGHVIQADTATSGLNVWCPACGRELAVPTVQSPAGGAALPPPIPVSPQVALPSPIVPARAGGSGLAIASLVCGIAGMPLCCLWMVSLPVATAAVIMGAISLAKKKPGKGMAIAGVVVGAAGVVLGLAVLALLLLASGTLGRGRRRVAAAPPSVVTDMVEDASGDAPPPVLTGDQIAEELTGPLQRSRDDRRAATELRRALAAYQRRRTHPRYLYECVQQFRSHLAYSGRTEPADPEHARIFEAASGELVDLVLEKYRQAGEYQQDGQWAEAREKYMELMRLLPDPSSAILRNARQQRDYCRSRQEAEERGDD